MSRFVFALLLWLPQSQPQRLDLEALVNKVSETYGRLKDLSADFEQIQKDSSNQGAHQWGHVYMKSGKKALFEYTKPRVLSECSDGKKYTKSSPFQATRTSISKTDGERLALLQIVGSQESRWKDQFSQKEELPDAPLTPGDRVVRLTPKNKDVRDVTVEVDPRNFMIHRLVFRYVDDQVNEFRFKNITTSPVDPARFKCDVPPGVELIEE